MSKIFMDAERFRLSEINIVPEPSGERFLNYKTVPEITGLKPGSSLFSYSLTELTATLNARPEVLRAEVDRRFPGTLNLHIDERVPVARLTSAGQKYLVDASGFAYSSTLCPTVLWESLPTLLGAVNDHPLNPESSYLDQHGLKRALSLIVTVRELGLELPLRTLRQKDDCSIEVQLKGGAVARFGLHDHARQARDLKLILDHALTTQREIQSVNLLPVKNIPVVFHEATGRPARTQKEQSAPKKDDLHLILGQG